nr:MAG TPA: hypothetical protein [Crassvirales sp.]
MILTKLMKKLRIILKIKIHLLLVEILLKD